MIIFNKLRENFKYAFYTIYVSILVFSILIGIVIGIFFSYKFDLPEIKQLENYKPSVVTEIFADDNTRIGEFYIERRKWVSYKDIPDNLKWAIISAEDSKFFKHFGIDIWGITRAAIKDILFHKLEGGSTITQQLAKNLFLTPEKSISRKIKEMILAFQIEKNYSKERIFTFYCNTIYLGHGNYGVEAASEYYFGKSVKDLTLDECALLAGLIKAPERFSPIKHPKRAKRRRNFVLRRMYELGYIVKNKNGRNVPDYFAYKSSLRKPIKVLKIHKNKTIAPYFVEWVRIYLSKRYPHKELYSGGLKIYTTLNVKLQVAAEKALRKGLRSYDERKGWRGHLRNIILEGKNIDTFKLPEWREYFSLKSGDFVYGLVLESDKESAIVEVGNYTASITLRDIKWTHYKKVNSVLHRGDIGYFEVISVDNTSNRLKLKLSQYPEVQGAFLAIDNKTGAIKAMVGGYDFEKSKFNRAMQAKRQTGSSFKPFVYTTALLNGYSPDDTILDKPFTIVTETGEEYSPENYDHKYKGLITLRQALAESRNVPAVRLGVMVGIERVIQTARKFGITAPLYPFPSTALGASEVPVYQMVSAYTVFPNEGVRAFPYFITRIEDSDGNILEKHEPLYTKVLPVRVSHEMISMLRGVVKYGTSVKAKVLNAEVAGKTGTTNNFTDTWFIGFNPSITAGVWVGFDEKKSLGEKETGSRDALPIWIDFMKVYLKDHGDEKFPADTDPGPRPHPVNSKGVGGVKGGKIIEENI